MRTLLDEATFTHEVKQSKFIAYLFPHASFLQKLEHLKQEHPKARHFVFAKRFLNEFDQVIENSSDDGEPRGTSGKPSLHVLQGSELINIAVVIVRYFGGTKLGTGGLVRAYSEAVHGAIINATLVAYTKTEEMILACDYKDNRLVEYSILACGAEIVSKEFADKSLYKLRGTKESLESLYATLERVVRLVSTTLSSTSKIPHRHEDSKR